MDLAASFALEARNSLRIFGAWPPGVPLLPGTYGVLEGAVFKPYGDIAQDFGITVIARPTETKLQFDFKSSGASEVGIELDAGADLGVMDGSARIKTKISFKRAGSTYFRTKDAVYHTIINLADVGHAIMSAFASGKWLGEFALVHGVFKAASTTIIISAEDHAEIMLEGTAAGNATLDLADLNSGIICSSDRNIAFKVMAKSAVTPLMCLSQIRPRNKWLGLVGLSEKKLDMLFQGRQSGATPQSLSDTILTQLAPRVSLHDVRELGMSPEELYHLTELL